MKQMLFLLALLATMFATAQKKEELNAIEKEVQEKSQKFKNSLSNNLFCQQGQNGNPTYSYVLPGSNFMGGSSAAERWTTFINGGPGTTLPVNFFHTELVTSACNRKGCMMRIEGNSPGASLGQAGIGYAGDENKKYSAYALIYNVRGLAGMSIGAIGTARYNTTSTLQNKWHWIKLEVEKSEELINQFLLFTTAPDGGLFYIKEVYLFKEN